MSNQTYGTRELFDLLQRPNPYDVYKDVAQRMKDAGFTQKPTMSRVLEELSPTPPSDKSGLDAFERLLKERGLITKTDLSAGYYASELGNFMRSTADKVLLMELGMRQWRKAATLGLEQRKDAIAQYRATLLSEDSIIGSWERPWFDAQTPRYSQQVVAPIPLSELVAMTTPIDTDAYRSVYLTYSAANVRQYRMVKAPRFRLPPLDQAKTQSACTSSGAVCGLLTNKCAVCASINSPFGSLGWRFRPKLTRLRQGLT